MRKLLRDIQTHFWALSMLLQSKTCVLKNIQGLLGKKRKKKEGLQKVVIRSDISVRRFSRADKNFFARSPPCAVLPSGNSYKTL